MRILFTKSDKIGSAIIRWGLEEPVSHVAVEAEGLVLHSTWSDVDIDSIETFLEHREIVYEIYIPKLGVPELLGLTERYAGSSYDFRGLVCFVKSALARKLFGTPLPKTACYNTPGAFLCTEIATVLMWGYENAAITPYELYLTLLTGSGVPYTTKEE